MGTIWLLHRRRVLVVSVAAMAIVAITVLVVAARPSHPNRVPGVSTKPGTALPRDTERLPPWTDHRPIPAAADPARLEPGADPDRPAPRPGRVI